jgi:hypothetical protein
MEPFPQVTTANSLRILRRVGVVLIAFGTLDVAYMITASRRAKAIRRASTFSPSLRACTCAAGTWVPHGW